jgi:hypothetical protein
MTAPNKKDAAKTASSFLPYQAEQTEEPANQIYEKILTIATCTPGL